MLIPAFLHYIRFRKAPEHYAPALCVVISACGFVGRSVARIASAAFKGILEEPGNRAVRIYQEWKEMGASVQNPQKPLWKFYTYK